MMIVKQPVQPIIVAHLFPEMRAELLSVLKSLTDEQWQLPTVCEGWNVKDVALHLLADHMGYLSRHRDKDGVTFRTQSWDELVQLINAQNDQWVQATRRLSRKLLISLLEFTGRQFDEYVQSLDISEGTHPIGWAGNEDAPMWLQVARELTEFWMHYQHIFEAVGEHRLKERRYIHPVIATFVHALPHTYRDVEVEEDTVIQLKITGEVDDSWYIVYENDAWRLYADTDMPPTSTVKLSDDMAWRLFTKGISMEDVRQQATITGDVELGEVLLNTIAIIA